MSNEYLSTGEAARILGISRSTVSRRFDDGSLRGKTHPITGERLISSESVGQFLNKHLRRVETNPLVARHLVLRSCSHDLISAIEGIAAADRRIKMEITERGSEALIRCARKPKDLLILDDTPTDIACPHIITSLREPEEGHKLAFLCCLRDTDPQQASSWGADVTLPLDQLTPDKLRSHIYSLLRLVPKERAYNATPVEHKRQWPRHTLHVPGTIGVYRVRTPEEQTWGTATVDNISLGGAGLSQVKVESNSLPAESFRMLLKIDTPPLPRFEAHCQVVRLNINGEVSAGVQFVHMSQESREKLMAMDHARDLALAPAVAGTSA